MGVGAGMGVKGCPLPFGGRGAPPRPRPAGRGRRARRRKSSTQDDALPPAPPVVSSSRNFSTHTTSGRHNSWSTPTIITVIARIARAIADTFPWSSATLMYEPTPGDRKSTRLNSSHGYISYAVFCLKKKKQKIIRQNIQDVI